MRNSLGSRCRPGSPEGRTETHEEAKEAEVERIKLCLLEKLSRTNYCKSSYPAYGREISVREETQWQTLEIWHLR